MSGKSEWIKENRDILKVLYEKVKPRANVDFQDFVEFMYERRSKFKKRKI